MIFIIKGIYRREKKKNSRERAECPERLVYCMRKRPLYPSGGQCSNSRNIDPAILPRLKFSDDWHPGTDHMPFAVPTTALIRGRHPSRVSGAVHSCI